MIEKESQPLCCHMLRTYMCSHEMCLMRSYHVYGDVSHPFPIGIQQLHLKTSISGIFHHNAKCMQCSFSYRSISYDDMCILCTYVNMQGWPQRLHLCWGKFLFVSKSNIYILPFDHVKLPHSIECSERLLLLIRQEKGKSTTAKCVWVRIPTNTYDKHLWRVVCVHIVIVRYVCLCP